jgi:hypothetical protein
MITDLLERAKEQIEEAEHELDTPKWRQKEELKIRQEEEMFREEGQSADLKKKRNYMNLKSKAISSRSKQLDRKGSKGLLSPGTVQNMPPFGKAVQRQRKTVEPN